MDLGGMNFEKYKFELGARIMKARLKKGLTQDQLAKAIGCSQPAITQIESGKSLPGTGTLFKLGKALDTSVNRFFPETVPNRVLGSTIFGLLWVRIRHWWYRRKRNKSVERAS